MPALAIASHRGPLRVGVVSDTHIPEARPELWSEVLDAFRGVDLILHGGDLHELVVLDVLGSVAPVHAARGNGEDGSAGRAVAPSDPRLVESWLLDLDGVRVGLTHDFDWRLVPYRPDRTPEQRAADRAQPDWADHWCRHWFETTDVDVVVHGHTHVEQIETVGDRLCINPGSPTYPRNLNTQLGTLALMDIADGVVRVAVHQLTAEGLAPSRVAPVEHRVRR